MFDLSKIEARQPWGLNSSCNPNIDFCVWVLQFDGIHISPFDHHKVGNQRLQQVGLDERAWYTWLGTTVATQDNRLCWHIADISKEVEKQLSTSQSVRRQHWSHLTQFTQRPDEIGDSTTQKFDTELERAQLNQYLHWKEQQYQEAAALAGSFSLLTPPSVVWEGEPRVRKQLELGWQEYLVTPKDTNRLEDLDAVGGFYQELRQKFSTRLPTLKIYLVHYPTPVFFPVPPVSILVSKAKDLPHEDLRKGIEEAAEFLAALRP
jgi:hypothetical protein